MNPEDIPEGGSPRNWDVDFVVGSVFTRPGLYSVYSFTSTLVITAYSVRYGIATFTYVGTTPTVNEGFDLSGFVGNLSYLNGLTVFVISVDPVNSTFTAAVNTADAGPFTGLSGQASSTTGNFTGPNLGTMATAENDGGNVWSNPNGILGDTSYASVTTGATNNTNEIPGVVANTSATNPWTNPGNFTAEGSTVSTVTVISSGAAAGQSSPALANDLNFSLPTDAQVVGISVTVNASSNGAAGSSALSTQLAIDGLPVGTAQTTPIGPNTTTYTQGGPSFTWGLALTPMNVNGSGFGVLVQALQISGTGTFTTNNLSVTVYYTTAGVSEALLDQTFNFSIPSSSGISGFGVTFQAFSSAATTVTFQLLKNGIPTGSGHTQVLTTVPTIYTLGGPQDLWGALWAAGDVNNTNFGVQIVAEDLGISNIQDVDMLVYLTPSLVNFNYIKTYEQDNQQIDTLALDASGIMWKEDVTNNPGVLSIALTGILPGSFAKSSTSDDQEYICFSDLNIGTERPRVYNGIQFLPLSQVGPGAPPLFVSQVGSSANTLTLTAFSISGDVVTFTYSTGIEPTAGEIYTITGATPTYLNYTNTVLSVPPPTSTQFSMEITQPDVTSTPISPTATATLANSYPILSITQPAINPFGFDSVLQSAGPGQTAPGNVLTLYYANTTFPPNAELLAEFATGNAVYVYLSIPSHDILGTYLVTSIGTGLPPGAGGNRYYFTVNVGNSTYFYDPAHPVAGTYQFTLATVTTSTPIPSLSPGDNITITGATPTGWDNSWPIVSALLSGVMNITSTAMSASGTATYGYTVQSGAPPANGEIVTVFNATNNAIFNATGVVSGSTGGTSGTFNINGFPAGAAIPQAFETQAVGQTFGTEFTFNPGAITVGTNISPIYGNDTGTGNVFTVGGSLVPIGAGTRQAVVFFITESGYETAPSPPIVFTTSSQANVISVINIPIGPPNVIARGIAFTEAGQNGVPGANFYVIENDVTETVFNVTTTYKSTIIRDNVTTSASFTFTDAVLLNSTAIDIQGNDLFNLIELGSCAWCVPYASRMFYGLQLNKVDNFNNLTFDGGYLPNPGGNLFPLGWNYVGTSNQNLNLIVSPVTGMALHIFNNTAAVLPNAGVIVEGAYLDPYNVAIINTNTTYSVRVAVSAPSGLTEGTLQISLQSYNPSIGLGAVYGTFQVPLSEMTSNIQVFTGTLLINPFVAPTNPLPTNLNLVVQVLGLGIGADVLIDRIEVFPTEEPYILAQVYGSYVDNLEAIDASGSGGIVDTSEENPQPCMGGFVMHDTLYLLKTDSMDSTEDNEQSEPGGWGVHEVSNKVGSVGINSYDVGEEWLLTACRSGIYGFNGGSPVKIMQEIYEIWQAINWNAGRAIWLRNDIINKRILCAIPLPTGTSPTGVPTTSVKWLPYAPYNPTPTTPNVMLICNYQGLNTFDELLNSPEMHTTMFGTLAAVDMKRKWTIWQIASPYADFITRQDNISKPLFICNGIDVSKIYQLEDDQLSDDGRPIFSLYMTYGFVNAVKAATLPIFGLHAKRYTVLQTTAYGAGTMQIRALQNTLGATYPYTVPGGLPLADPVQGDYFRPLNQRAQRMFLEFSTSAVNSWFNLSKLLLSGKADNYTLNPTGGGNQGFPSA